MSGIPRFFGLELEVFPPETPVIRSKSDLRKISDSGETHVVRQVNPGGFTSLGHTLKVVDRRFKALEEACDVRVVDHRWGLYPIDPTKERWIPHYSEPRVPRNHLVVARVEVIRNLTPLSDDESADLRNEIIPWQTELWQAGKAYPPDLGIVQFGKGENPNNEPATWLLDVDPQLDVSMRPTQGVLNKLRTAVEYPGNR
jgi:hypothetical protein